MTSSTDARRAARSAPRGTSKVNPAFAIAFFARTIRCAIAASLDRKTRAISSVVRPPTTLRVTAARASGDSMGWQAVKMRPSSSSPRSSFMAASIASAAPSRVSSSVRAISWCLRSRILSRRKASTARRLATAISQAPGLAGTPVLGHSDRATTSASCASSSARSTFRTMRARPAMSLARSMRKVASIARCGSPALTPHFRPRPQGRQALGPTVSGDAELSALPVTGRRELLGRQKLGQIRRLQERPELDLAPARHEIGAALRPGHGLVHVLDLPDRKAGDQLPALGERPVDHRLAGTVEDDALGLCPVLQAGAGDEDTCLDELLREPVHRRERLRRGGRALFTVLSGFPEYHHPHRLPPCVSRPDWRLIVTTNELAGNRHRSAN